MKYTKWLDKNTTSLIGKTVAITGATGGLGQEVVKYLAYLGANIITINRSTKKSEQLIKSIKSGFPYVEIKNLICDLTNTNDIKNTISSLKGIKLDYIILNSAIYACERYKTQLGIDNIMQTNFVAHFRIVRELKEQLQKNNTKIIAVGSIAHKFARFDKNDLQLFNVKKINVVYGTTKKFLMLCLENWCNKKNIKFSIAHPGIAFTNITSHYPKFVFAIIKYPMKIIFNSPKLSALSIVYSLFCDTKKEQWIGPRLFNIWGKPKIKKLKYKHQNQTQNILAECEKFYNSINFDE